MLKEELGLSNKVSSAIQSLAYLYVAFDRYVQENRDPDKRKKNRKDGWQLICNLVGIDYTGDVPLVDYAKMAPIAMTHPWWMEELETGRV